MKYFLLPLIILFGCIYGMEIELPEFRNDDQSLEMKLEWKSNKEESQRLALLDEQVKAAHAQNCILFLSKMPQLTIPGSPLSESGHTNDMKVISSEYLIRYFSMIKKNYLDD